FFFFQAEDGIRDFHVTGVQTCALPIYFAVLNAPFKMSLFFLIAAYVRPMAVDRRRSKPYVRPRVKKLGGPILVGFFPVIPVLMWAYYLNFRAYGSIGFGDYYWHVCLGQG